ncbi:MAG: hypothetical protein KAJ60_09595 [Desulfobulbaceae bacterium]|nr:hypothetical protein [Desulfobulbaceae bacterium]
MPPSKGQQPQGEKIRKAIRWISDTVLEHPEKKRRDILRDAEIRFDLTPKECEFLNSKFCGNNCE